MTLVTWTQLYRNCLCVLSTLLPPTSFFKQPIIPIAPPPIGELTWIELPIAITQIMGCWFCIVSGSVGMVEFTFEYYKLHGCLRILDKLALDIDDSVNRAGVFTILRHGIRKDIERVYKKFYISFWEFCIGCAFGILACNTFHLTHPKLVIDAIILLELSLSYILFCMLQDFYYAVLDCWKCHSFINLIKKKKPELERNVHFLQTSIDVGYVTNLLEVVSLLFPKFIPKYRGAARTSKALQDDISAVFYILNGKKGEKVVNPLHDPLTLGDNVLDILEKEKIKRIINAAYGGVYCLLNSIAFFGYFQNILAFYFPRDSFSPGSLSFNFVNFAMLFQSTETAVWYGTFLGDFVWTLEPFLALTSPLVIRFLTEKINNRNIDKSKKQN